MTLTAPYVEVSGLCVVAAEDGAAPVPIINDVSFAIARGEVLALIGESGSGKTTIALALMGYARRGCRITAAACRIGDTTCSRLPPHGLTACADARSPTSRRVPRRRSTRRSAS